MLRTNMSYRSKLRSRTLSSVPRRAGITLRIRRFISTSICHVLVLLSLLAGCDALQTPDPNVNYIAFGDSSTDGPSSRDYVEFLPELLDEPTRAFVNQGRGGEDVADGVDRLQSILDRDLYVNATTLMFWQGGTDLIDFILSRDPLLLRSPTDSDYPFSTQLDSELDRIQAEIEAAIFAGRSAGLNVLVATYYPLPDSSLNCAALFIPILTAAQSVRANQYVNMLNDRIRLAALSNGARLVDVATLLGSTLRGDPRFYFDCNHLSAAGNDRVAQLFATVIEGP